MGNKNFRSLSRPLHMQHAILSSNTKLAKDQDDFVFLTRNFVRHWLKRILPPQNSTSGSTIKPSILGGDKGLILEPDGLSQDHLGTQYKTVTQPPSARNTRSIRSPSFSQHGDSESTSKLGATAPTQTWAARVTPRLHRRVRDLTTVQKELYLTRDAPRGIPLLTVFLKLCQVRLPELLIHPCKG